MTNSFNFLSNYNLKVVVYVEWTYYTIDYTISNNRDTNLYTKIYLKLYVTVHTPIHNKSC